MRFGLCYWSEDGDDFKHKLVLVEHRDDLAEKPLNPLAAVYLWHNNVRKQAVRSLSLEEELIETLVQKGTLTTDEAHTLREKAKDRHTDLTFEVFQIAMSIDCRNRFGTGPYYSRLEDLFGLPHAGRMPCCK